MLDSSVILAFVEAFLAESDAAAKMAAGPTAKGVSAAQLGRSAARDPSLVYEMRAGRDLRPKKIVQLSEAIERMMPGFEKRFFKTARIKPASDAEVQS